MNQLNIDKNIFPILKNKPELIYLDSAATSLKPQQVLDKINEYYANYGVNIHRGVYDLSQKASDEYAEARTIMAKFINANDDEVIFTKGTTDSLNMVSYMLNDLVKEHDEILVSELDHHSSIIPLQELSKRTKANLKYIELDQDNDISLDNLKKELTSNTKIVNLSYVSNVLGRIEPLKELISFIHNYNKDIIVIVDAAQAAPHIKIDVKDLDCDFLAFSLHKMLGPTGVGVLYGKNHLLNSLNPVEFGGDMNDGVDLYSSTYKDSPERFEAGTPNIEGVIASMEAIKLLDSIGMENVQKHSSSLSKYVIDQIKDLKEIKLYTKHSDTGIVTFNILGIHPHDTATFLATYNICVRAGHHCAQLITKHLRVIGTVRASFYIYNTMEDAEKLVKAIKEAINYFKEWM